MPADVIIDGLEYPVVIADDASLTLPRLLTSGAASTVIAFDRSVESRAGVIATALRTAGVSVLASVELTGGENLKRWATVAGLYDSWLERGVERSTTVVAIGGGTVTDVVGYAAATYLRGIAWAAVPTTVLGMADASIGGKTGIDLPQGKNLVGAFWPPRAVVADLASLTTLPARERSTGLAEAVKCAIIGDPPLLDAVDRLSPQGTPESWKDVIVAAASVKVAIVAGDPRESGRRAVLNLGHTVGHAIEFATDFRIAHGEAVSVGLRAAGLIARAQGWWPENDHRRVLSALHRAGLPLHAAGVLPDVVMKAMSRDKKNVDGRVRFVLPIVIGDVRHGIEVAGPVARAAVEACLAPPPASEWRS